MGFREDHPRVRGGTTTPEDLRTYLVGSGHKYDEAVTVDAVPAGYVVVAVPADKLDQLPAGAFTCHPQPSNKSDDS